MINSRELKGGRIKKKENADERPDQKVKSRKKNRNGEGSSSLRDNNRRVRENEEGVHDLNDSDNQTGNLGKTIISAPTR